jgi:hypothetical protein
MTSDSQQQQVCRYLCQKVPFTLNELKTCLARGTAKRRYEASGAYFRAAERKCRRKVQKMPALTVLRRGSNWKPTEDKSLYRSTANQTNRTEGLCPRIWLISYGSCYSYTNVNTSTTALPWANHKHAVMENGEELRAFWHIRTKQMKLTRVSFRSSLPMSKVFGRTLQTVLSSARRCSTRGSVSTVRSFMYRTVSGEQRVVFVWRTIT